MSTPAEASTSVESPEEPGLHEQFRKRSTFKSLDGVRCAAIVAVVFHHGQGGIEFGRLTDRGFLGVDMFFVLSGFLIVTLLLRERDKHQRISLKDFYMRRTLRIFPLYYLVVGICAVLFGLIKTDGVNGQNLSHDLPYLLTYTANWFPIYGMLGIAWSLAAEEQFYLVWPFVEKHLKKHSLTLLVVLLLLSEAIQFGLLDGPLANLGFSATEPGMLRETTFAPILLGVLLAHAFHHRKSFDLFARLAGARWMPALWGVLIVLACAFFPKDLIGWPRPVIHILMFLFLGSVVVHEDHILASLMRLKPIVRLGTLCYGMYLWHMFVQFGITTAINKGMPQVLEFPTLLFATWVVSELSFRFFEKPFLKLKHRFAR